MEESMILGGSVGVIMSLSLSDKIGRRRTILTSIIFTLIGIILITLTKSVEVISLGLLLWGAGGDTTFSALTSYITEVGD